MKHWLLVTACTLLLPPCGMAATAEQVQRTAEHSMVVTGSITVAPNGSVRSYGLDRQDKLPPVVVQVIRNTMSGWKFEPILLGGRPVAATTDMSLRVDAKPLANGSFAVSVADVSFGDDSPNSSPTYKWTSLPLYPDDAPGVGCTVYLVARLSLQGQVENIDVRQINLRVAVNSGEMIAYRKEFADAVLRSAHGWKFSVPKTSPVGQKDWVVIIPVNFQPLGIQPPSYGKWAAYVPGPVLDIPWFQTEENAGNESVDSVPANGLAFHRDWRFQLVGTQGNG